MENKNKNKGVSDAGHVEFQAPTAPKPRGRTLKVRKIGNSLGVVLPKEVLAKLGVGEGDELSVSETPDGVALTGYNEEVQRQLDIGRDLMKRYRNALRELAK
jgi:putative addiction module antidote